MSSFKFADLEAYNSAKSNKTQKTFERNDSPRIGFFKLADGKDALVRINVSSVDQLDFASVHHPAYGQKWEGLSNPFAGISCLNPIGEYDSCPLCKAVADGNTVIGKASKKVYVKMLVSYRGDDNKFTAPVPVVWERPAGFARELATKLQNYGDLRESLFVISRAGSGQDTTYTLDYAVPAVYKPDMIPADFSAFDNFKINKHSYYEVSAEDIETYLTTGSFPEAKKDIKVEEHKTVADVVREETTGPSIVVEDTPVTPDVPVETPVAAPKVEAPAANTTKASTGGFNFNF